MNQLTRLDSISPELSELFQIASANQRSQAVLAACLKAIADTDLNGNEVEAAIEALRSGATDVGLAHRLNALSDHFDERYFSLGDDDNPAPPNALPFFQKARAAAALAFAVSSDPTEGREALYEAISASSGRAEIMQIAKVELTAR